MRYLAFTVLLAAASPPSAQSVEAGIKAWQSGDAATAVAIWKPLAAKGDADARFNLAQAYKLGRGVPVDLAQAQRLYEQAARQNHRDAQTTLGLLLFQNGSRAAALRWLKLAAEGGEPRAMLVYGTALFNGDGVARDPVEAYAMVSRAAAQGLQPAKATLAEMDRLLPLAERQAGVAKALAAAKGRARPRVAAERTRPAATPAVKPTSAGQTAAWRVQLGAFTKRSSAEELFARLSRSQALPGKQPVLIPSGAMTRLQVGPYATRAEAAAACKVLLSRGQGCFPVPAR